ncbi:RecX family transcriptional regulator [Sphingomonas lycopersici]|uniref:Regulatory protein RecX n=1 Tax=Sphingomonas lycopersici TaxID=2951807 RepID=A0AA42CUI0_9SPHN|nr:RecX family transcriptional regulator [Sphingomonas lycopersici]
MTRERHALPRPLDAAALDQLALRYVERFATTRGKLADYLRRKVRERGWQGAPVDPAAVAERMAALGYVNDRAFAAMRAASLARRGFGARRVAQALHAAQIDAEDTAAALAELAEEPGAEAQPLRAALAFAKRRRFGPWAREAPDARLVERQVAAMIRAGHAHALARRIVTSPPGVPFEGEE